MHRPPKLFGIRKCPDFECSTAMLEFSALPILTPACTPDAIVRPSYHSVPQLAFTVSDGSYGGNALFLFLPPTVLPREL